MERAGPELLAAALGYVERGWPVIPCQGKVPCKAEGLLEHGISEARVSPFWVRQWWQRWPGANIALAAGAAAGWWAVDIDVRDDKPGDRTLGFLEGLFGALPATLTQLTPTGGRHLLFAWEADRPVKNSASKRLGPGLDTRSEGGYVLGAPSIHPDTRTRYRWQDETAAIVPAPEWLLRLLWGEPDDRAWLRGRLPEGAAVPDWLAQRLEGPRSVGGTPTLQGGAAMARRERVPKYAAAALEGECKRVRDARPGTQNDTLNEASFKLGSLVGGGSLEEGLAYQHLIAAALAMAQHYDARKGPWKIEHLEQIVCGGLEAGKKEPRALPEPPAPKAPGSGRSRRLAVSPPDPGQPGGVAGGGGAADLAAAQEIWRRRLPAAMVPAVVAALARWGIEDPAADRWAMFGAAFGLAPAPGLAPGPGLIAAYARWPERAVAAVALAWLDDQGRRRRDAGSGPAAGLRWIGARQGCALRLAPLADGCDRLVVASSIRAGIRACLAQPGWPVWAVPGAVAAAGLVVPEPVKRIVLVGFELAQPAVIDRAARHLSAGVRSVRLAQPVAPALKSPPAPHERGGGNAPQRVR